MALLSIVVPCYNEQENIADFYTAVMEQAPALKALGADLELIYVDDGSKDDTVGEIKKMYQKDKRIRMLSFSRNFGKEAAIYAGMSASKGDYVVIMDVDLQDPPALLPEMLRYVESGEYDSVGTRRVSRKGEPPIRSFFARWFYRIMRKLSKTDIVDGARDYRLMNRRFVDAVLSMKEYNRFSKGIFGWVGFKNKWLEFENVERRKGETKWNFWKLFLYSMDGIFGFSTMPLMISTWCGLVLFILSVIALVFIVVRKLFFGDPVDGWASTACIIIFLGGIQLFCIGILGQYMSRIYLEVKDRPIYIVREEL